MATIIRKILIVSFAVLLMCDLTNAASMIRAQSSIITIAYGETVEGQITANTSELVYTFQGEADDVVIITMVRAGTEEESLKASEFMVFSGRRKIIDTTNIIHYFDPTIAFQLQTAGEYQIVATRRDGKSVGKFTLGLFRATPLKINTPVKDTASDKGEKYYVFEPEAPFKVSYIKVGGPFGPEIVINAVNTNGTLDRVADLAGKDLESGEMTVTPQRGLLYLLRVGKEFFSATTGNAEYVLTFMDAKS